MIRTGVANQSKLTYSGKQQICDSRMQGDFRAVSWGFVSSDDKVPLISQVKQSICRYGPLSAAMAATPAFQAYVRGYFNEKSSAQVNHAVAIVGWDDNAGGKGKGAWLIKNSW